MTQYHLFDTTARWQRLGLLLEFGGEVFEALGQDEPAVEFQPWVVAVKERLRIKQVGLDQSEAEWLWDVLRSEPGIRRDYGDLPSAGVTWFRQSEQFKVLREGECFAIGLTPADVRKLLETAGSPGDETIIVRLLEGLRMCPGKANRLECRNVLAEVTIPIDGVASKEAEAAIARVDPELVRVGDRSVTIITRSLNQSFTAASRRLKPSLRSHGGHTYDRLVYLGRSQRLLLEEIRRRVETGKWEVPGRDQSSGDSAGR